MAFVGTMLQIALAAVVPRQSSPSDPFAPIDPQNWVNPDNMTWDGMSQHRPVRLLKGTPLSRAQTMSRPQRPTGQIPRAKVETATSTSPWLPLTIQTRPL